MNREIKFRAWHKEEKEMVYFSFTDNIVTKYDKDDLVICSNSGGWSFYDEGLVIMQYTGLKDKNGKEIWEGDILSSNMGKGVVEWHDAIGSWSVEFGMDWGMIETDIVEVIGNCFENPELMENK